MESEAAKISPGILKPALAPMLVDAEKALDSLY
jgi:hypothetical protein